MLLESASSLLPLAMIVGGVALLAVCCLPSRKRASVWESELDSKIATLQELLHLARSEAQRLERAIEQAQAIEIAPPLDELAAIENLGGPAAMADSNALASTADQFSQSAPAVAADLFAIDHQLLSVARLADQGHTASDIARRLGKPIGDVELLLSLRSA